MSNSPDETGDTVFIGTLYEFDAELIPVKPGDILSPRLGRPHRELSDADSFKTFPQTKSENNDPPTAPAV